MRFPVVITITVLLSLNTVVAEGPPVPVPSEQPIATDSEGRYVIESCPTVWVENESFFLCDVDDLVIAFTPRPSEFKKQREYFISVWNTGGTTFDYHPQNARMTVPSSERTFVGSSPEDRKSSRYWKTVPGAPKTVAALSFVQFEKKLKPATQKKADQFAEVMMACMVKSSCPV